MRQAHFSQESGDKHLLEDLPLLGISFESKEAESVVTLGRNTIEYEHRLTQPKELWSVEDEIPEFIDDKNGHTVLSQKL